jgi:ABC-2 type transport system ATP-binding protein
VREYCDRAILINEGVISHEGDALEVASEYLKLFNKVVSSEKASASRWGNKQAEFTGIEATALNSGEGIRITGKLQANEDIEDLVAGVRVKSSSGVIVTGFNSEDAGRLNLTKGQKGVVEFIVPDIFGNDIFAVDATLRLSDGVTICDNWDDAASFSILKNTKAPYSVVPEVKVRLEKEKS